MKENILHTISSFNNMIAGRRHEIVEILLRVGVAIAFVYPADEASFYPQAWIGVFPLWMRDLPIDDQLMLNLFGASEILIALWILIGKKIFIPSVLASGYLFSIIVLNWKFMDLLFRDIAILAIPLALAVMSYPWSKKEVYIPVISQQN